MLIPDETQRIRSGIGPNYGSVSGQLMEVCRVSCRKCVRLVVGSVSGQLLEVCQVSCQKCVGSVVAADDLGWFQCN